VDLDHDGDLDFVHTAFQTTSVPEHRLEHRQLLTSAYYERRRKLEALVSGVWLNPGWDVETVIGVPFTPGDFEARTGKDYFFAAGDVDNDGLTELAAGSPRPRETSGPAAPAPPHPHLDRVCRRLMARRTSRR
jgi:hypothetical protein